MKGREFQSLMQTIPEWANNPLFTQRVNDIATDPAAAEFVSSIARRDYNDFRDNPTRWALRNPNLALDFLNTRMQQPNAASAGGGMPPLRGAGFFPPAEGDGAPPPRAWQQQQQGSTGRSAEEMTEEEMIDEAIRRSLRDES
jgi:hypothetical protein